MNHLPSFQKAVDSFVKAHHLETSVEARVLDLVSEVGEVAKEVLKGNQYGHQDFEPGQHWADELADAFFSLICVANSTTVNLDEALAQALKKYQERLTQKGDAGSGQ